METAIDILQDHLQKAGAMQSGPAATAYCESLKLAIQVLEAYNKEMRAEISRRVKSAS